MRAIQEYIQQLSQQPSHLGGYQRLLPQEPQKEQSTSARTAEETLKADSEIYLEYTREGELISAIESSDITKINELLTKGANPNVQTRSGSPILFTPVDAIFYKRQAWISEEAVNKNFSIIKLLLEAGADPTIQRKGGFSAIMIAAVFENENSIALTKCLLEAKIKPILLMGYGLSFLDQAGKEITKELHQILPKYGTEYKNNVEKSINQIIQEIPGLKSSDVVCSLHWPFLGKVQVKLISLDPL
jgi:hypothetical protein